jgi:hypothetical protein
MVNQEQRDRFVLFGETAEEIERAGARIGADNAILGTILGAEITFDGAEDFGIVINCENYWPWQR